MFGTPRQNIIEHNLAYFQQPKINYDGNIYSYSDMPKLEVKNNLIDENSASEDTSEYWSDETSEGSGWSYAEEIRRRVVKSGTIPDDRDISIPEEENESERYLKLQTWLNFLNIDTFERYIELQCQNNWTNMDLEFLLRDEIIFKIISTLSYRNAFMGMIEDEIDMKAAYVLWDFIWKTNKVPSWSEIRDIIGKSFKNVDKYEPLSPNMFTCN